MSIEDNSASSTSITTKRKRASKPKVRTGCITCVKDPLCGHISIPVPWSVPGNAWTPNPSIRRVKCDETKPACTRCTSTGRKCDGYGGAAPPRRKKPSPSPSLAPPNPLAFPFPAGGVGVSNNDHNNLTTDPYLTKRHELAQHSFAAACRGNSALRILRPLAADIEGTEQERLFFHRFRRAAEAGLATHASGLGPGFWRRLVPQVGHSDPAVRHALIALGAAYESAQLQLQLQQQQQQTSQHYAMAGVGMGMGSGTSYPDVTSRASTPTELPYRPYTAVSTPPPEEDGAHHSCHHRIDQLELFTIQQYNLSIYHLQRNAAQPALPSPLDSVETTLICCLVFVCIETSRGNEAAALAHVASGLQIIRGLPPGQEPAYFPLFDGCCGDHHATTGEETRGQSPSRRLGRADWRQLLDFFLALEPNVLTYGLGSQPPTPPTPFASAWSPPLGYFDDLIPQWDIEAMEMEM
ncbi:hypothetical protein GGR54DRAFT_652275 [Hypoxylon sp. NC1633]|nr:hypothetical protein GGR54DRAFT_652275 [Hypoxylon sp. NC1633]